jgi:hypothetical protein
LTEKGESNSFVVGLNVTILLDTPVKIFTKEHLVRPYSLVESKFYGRINILEFTGLVSLHTFTNDTEWHHLWTLIRFSISP